MSDNLNLTNTLTSNSLVDEQNNVDKKKPAKKKENLASQIEVLDFPNRTLPKLIEELLEKNIPVNLSKNGYYIGGFYGLNSDNQHLGFALAQDTVEANTLVFYDNKNNKHIIKSFEDLVKFNNVIWGVYFKLSEKYKKPDSLWFSYMLQY